MTEDARRPPETRQTPSIGAPPPAEDLIDFPVWHIHAGTILCRVTTSGLGPWWFSSDGAGRFDLGPPRGTCYLADDAVGALLEVLGPVLVVSTTWAARLSLWQLGLPEQCSAADTTVRAARGFGVTAELASITPYALPQRWASAFAGAGHQGVRYRARHDPGGSRALALFGAAGERRWPRGRSRAVDADVLARLASEAGVRSAPLPATSDLGEIWGLTPPPAARRDDTLEVIHGVEVPDPYRWLEDAGSPDTQTWVEAGNARTRAALDGRADRADLVARYTELFAAGTSGSPSIRGGRLFSLDRWGSLEQAVLVVRDVHGDRVPAARVLIDPHDLAGDRTAALDWYAPSVDGRLVAFGISTGGDERSTLGIVDVATGERLPDTIPGTRAASVTWAPDGSAFAYTRYPDPAAVGDDEANYHRTVWWHVVGDDPGHDELVFGDLPDRTAWPSVELSRDGRWLVVEVSLGWTRVDVHVIDRTSGERTTVIEGVEAVSSFTVVGDRLVGTTTLDAPRGRVVAAELSRPTPDAWRTVVAESDDVVEGIAVTASSLLVASTRSAMSRLARLPLTALSEDAGDNTGGTGDTGDGGRRGDDSDGGADVGHDQARPTPTTPVEIALPEAGSLGGVAGDRDSETAVISFTSWARPSELWRWTPAAPDLPGAPDEGLVRWSDLPSPVDPAGYAVGVHHYPSTDGTEITLFTVRRGDVEPSPATATLLLGYGGFAVTMSPGYSPTAVAVADDGGVFAVACIRGGAEAGEEWHRAGMREHKQQVFDDFAAAADWLVDSGRTSRDHLAVRGGSNGGLLVATAMTQRPDLCRAVVCAVPLTDMVRFPRFLIARLWTPEYGDPDVAEEFAWLWAYSPYHHVVEGTCYPATLVLTGEHDSRVDPAHARKFGAALAWATSCGDDRPVLVRVETRAGHGQGKPASQQAAEAADVHTFLRWQIGLGS